MASAGPGSGRDTVELSGVPAAGGSGGVLLWWLHLSLRRGEAAVLPPTRYPNLTQHLTQWKTNPHAHDPAHHHPILTRPSPNLSQILNLPSHLQHSPLTPSIQYLPPPAATITTKNHHHHQG